ncbi:MAG: CHAD domain-containing protein [Thermomicrobiales bacterium]
MAKPWPVPDLDPQAPIAPNARAILAVRAGELLSYDAIFPDAKAIAALHNARIAAKRLRYTLELFPDVFGDDGDAALADVRALQEELGLVHDRDVMIATIQTRLGSLIEEHGANTDAIRASLEVVLARVTRDRKTQHRAVAAQWKRLMKGDFRDRLALLSGDHTIPVTSPA